MVTRRSFEHSLNDRKSEVLVFGLLVAIMALVLGLAFVGVLTSERRLVESQTLTVMYKEYAGDITYLYLSNDKGYKTNSPLAVRLNIGDHITMKRMNNEHLQFCRRNECTTDNDLLTPYQH